MFIVVDIGCIECGQATEVLGAYKTSAEAKAAHQLDDDGQREYFSRGQHSVEIFEIEVPA